MSDTSSKHSLLAGPATIAPGLPVHVAAARASWQYRVIEATGAHTSAFGQIILAILGRAPNNPPRIVGKAIVSKAGEMYCSYQGGDGYVRVPFHLCSTVELRDNLRGLADHLKLADVDREALFLEARHWVTKDFRAIGEPGYDVLQK